MVSPIAVDVMDLAADLLTLVADAGRVVRKHPLSAAQVGDAHRRQQHPRSFSGGNVIGTRRMQLKMPYLLRMFQNGLLLRSSRTLALPSGIRYLPIRIDRRGGRISTELSLA